MLRDWKRLNNETDKVYCTEFVKYCNLGAKNFFIMIHNIAMQRRKHTNHCFSYCTCSNTYGKAGKHNVLETRSSATAEKHATALQTPQYNLSGSFKVNNFGTNRTGIGDFLLVINSNLDDNIILRRFRDNCVRKCKNRRFYQPQSSLI